MAGPVVHSPIGNSEIENSALNPESIQSNPTNVTQDDFMTNELRRISQQQTEEESIRRSMQEQLNSISESMKIITNGMKIIQSQHQQSTNIFSSPQINRGVTEITQPTELTQTTQIATKPRKPEAFTGSRSCNPTLWLQQMKRYLVAINVEPAVYTQTAASYLSDSALQWWEGELMLKNSEDQDYSWNEFKELFLQRFQPIELSSVSLSKLTNWKQNGNLESYINGFMSLSSCIPLDLISEKARIVLFLKGLKTNIGSVVMNANPITLQQAINVAQRQSEFARSDEITQFSSTYKRNWSSSQIGRNYSFDRPRSRGSLAISNGRSSQLSATSEHEEETGLNDRETEGQIMSSSSSENTLNAVQWNEEQKRLFRENKCFNCKRVGHQIRHCQVPRQYRSQILLNELPFDDCHLSIRIG